jgi:putative glycosyltransferase (TIGR04372 family)
MVYSQIREMVIKFLPSTLVQYIRKLLYVFGNIYWFVVIKIRDAGLFTYSRVVAKAHNLRIKLKRTIWRSKPFSTIRTLVYKVIIHFLPQRKWAYYELLNLWAMKANCYHYRSSLGSNFIKYFERLWEIDPTSIIDYRRNLYLICTGNYNLSQMENYAQRYIDTQEKIIQSQSLEKINIRFSHSPVFDFYHLHGYLDTHIKAMLLGWQPHHKKVFLLPSNQYIANPCMFEYWQKYIEVKFLDSNSSAEIIAPHKKYLEDDFDWAANLNGSASYIEYAKCIVQKQWEHENRPPLLQLTTEDYEFGWNQLAKFGIPKNSWFVSLHVRDAGYNLGSYLAKDEYDSYRNADIDSYREAIDAIVQRGGYVIRVGDPKMKPLPKMEGVLDYALSDIYSNRMDIFLFSQCRFFVGVASGPILNLSPFGIPAVMTNYLPTIARPHASNCIFMPKLLWLNNENRYATFSEVLASELGRMYTSHGYVAHNVTVMDNKPGDIKDAVLEMMDWLEDKVEYSEEDEELQNRFNALYRKYSGYGDQGRGSRAFLKKYSQLL